MAEKTLAKPTSKDLEAAYAAILDGKPVEGIGSSGDPEVVSRAIAERILNADTFEEAFATQDLESWSDYVNTPVKVVNFHLNPSGFTGEGGASIYAVVDIAILAGDGQGDVRTVTCGGRNVLAQLVKMLEKGWLDKAVKLVAKQTASGQTALWLQPADA